MSRCMRINALVHFQGCAWALVEMAHNPKRGSTLADIEAAEARRDSALAVFVAAGGIAPTKASYRAHRIPIHVIRELARTRQIVAVEVEGRPRWAVRTLTAA